MAWIYPALMWVLLVAGVAVGLRAWLWDRAGFRGRAALRCRRCWFDLTASPGDLKEAPIVCPECGKQHASRRSMRKTRRHKRWVLVALVLLVGAYGAGVWPRVKQHRSWEGWIAFVPTSALVLAVPMIDDQAGSLPNRTSPAFAMPSHQLPLAERVANVLKHRMYDPERSSSLSRWLLLRIARREESEVLTEPLAIRGDLYRYILQAWVRERRLSPENERWARSVHQLRIDHAATAPELAPAYAQIEVRRLIDQGYWRVRVHKTLYDVERRRWPEGRDGFRTLEPVGREVNDWWDGNAVIFDEIYMNSGFSIPPRTSFTRSIEGMIYEGDPHTDIWWPVARVSRDVEFGFATMTAKSGSVSPDHAPTIESIHGFNVVADPERYVGWLQENLEIRLTQGNFWWRGEAFPDSFTLHVDEEVRNDADIPGFTFGGIARIVLNVRRGPRSAGEQPVFQAVVMESAGAWWALRDERDGQGRRVFEHGWHEVPIRPADSYVRVLGLMPVGWRSIAENDEVVDGYLEIRFGSNRAGEEAYRALADLEIDQILTEPIRVPLKRGVLNRLFDVTHGDFSRRDPSSSNEE